MAWVALLFNARAQPEKLPWRGGWVAIVVGLLAVLNGLTPYTEIKTAYGFNMYANLLTARGQSESPP